MTDWNLIIQGNISLLWLQKCMENKNDSISLNGLLTNYMNENENVPLINAGVLMMAAYLLFLYPKESEISKPDYTEIDFSIFTVHERGKKQVKETEAQYFLRRIRNSIAHGNWYIKYNNIILFDKNIRKNENLNEFKIETELSKFGEFINSFMFNLKSIHFSEKMR